MGSAPTTSDARPWVKRLGTYLRIFGVGHPAQIAALARLAQERELEFGSRASRESERAT